LGVAADDRRLKGESAMGGTVNGFAKA